ncbi:MAG: iron chelate uptake ABC transporter family permease subunit, partial [Chloroflexota bacterium]
MSVHAVSGDLAPAGLAARVRGRPGVVAAVGLVILAVTMTVAVGLGSVRIGPFETIGVILQRIFGVHLGGWPAATEAIVWELRLPRVLTAAVVGAGLAVAGATFQGIVRNPL